MNMLPKTLLLGVLKVYLEAMLPGGFHGDTIPPPPNMTQVTGPQARTTFYLGA